MHWIVLLLLPLESTPSDSTGVMLFVKRDDEVTHGPRVAFPRPFRGKRLKFWLDFFGNFLNHLGAFGNLLNLELDLPRKS